MSQKAADLDEKMRETLVKLDEMKGLIFLYLLVTVTAVKSGQARSVSKSKKLFVFLCFNLEKVINLGTL